MKPFIAIFCLSWSLATVIHIPVDFMTIQAGIDQASAGDTVLVDNGYYPERLEFSGLPVTVASNYLLTHNPLDILTTIIDGHWTGSPVNFAQGDDHHTLFMGFSVTGGGAAEGNPECMENANFCGEGAGIRCVNQSSPTLRNLLIRNNTGFSAGGVYCADSNPLLINVTIAYNEAQDEFYNRDAGIFAYNSEPVVINSILYQNQPVNVNAFAEDGISAIRLAHTTVDQNWFDTWEESWPLLHWLEGIVQSDPLWVDPEDGNYQLLPGSNCLESGVADYEFENGISIHLDPNDYAGLAPDRGALEYQEVAGLTYGCTDSHALNYNPEADASDGGCEFFQGPIFHVSADGDPNGTGSAESPFDEIQTGIHYASAGDTLQVAPGIYQENLHSNGKGLTLRSLYNESGDSTYIQNTIVDGSGIRETLLLYQIDDFAFILDGFTLRNGVGYSNDRAGGVTGMAVLDLQLANSIIENHEGSGLLSIESVVKLEKVILDNCRSYYSLYAYDSNILSQSCKIKNNYDGGGLLSRRSYMNMADLIVSDNRGDGFNVNEETFLNLTNSFICYNDRGMDVSRSTINLNRVLIYRNLGSYHGGGMIIDTCSPVLYRVIIAGNHAIESGGIRIFNDEAEPIYPALINSIVFDNDDDGIESNAQGVHLLVLNSIVRDNWLDDIALEYGEATVVYSNISGNWAGEGNIDADPLFTDPVHLDFTLLPDSPCIDAGTSSFDWQGELIFEVSEEEYDGLAPDMGADRFDLEYPLADATIWHVALEGDDENQGSLEFPLASFGQAYQRAQDGDTILVHPGIYYGHVHLYRKNIILGSRFLTTGDESYIESTVLNGAAQDHALTVSHVDADTRITGFTVTNGSHLTGAGIFVTGSAANLDHLVVENNTGSGVVTMGGGINIINSQLTLSHLVVRGNSLNSGLLQANGAGIYASASDIQGEYILLANNTGSGVTSSSGAGLYAHNCNLQLDHLTVSANNSGDQCGGIRGDYLNSLVLTNSIIWGNTQPGVYLTNHNPGDQPTVTYVDIEGGVDGIQSDDPNLPEWVTHILDADPLFVSFPDEDYHLQPESPCIDAGDPDSPADPDGTVADLGVFPYQQMIEDELIYFDDILNGLEDDYLNFSDTTGLAQIHTITIDEVDGGEIGDEIGLLDYNGQINFGNCDDEYGEILVGAGVWRNAPLEIITYGAMDFCDEVTNEYGQYPGWIEGHPIVVLYWRAAENQVYAAQLNGDGQLTWLPENQNIASLAPGATPLIDVNADYNFNILDVVFLVNAVLGTVTLNEDQFEMADINDDGQMNIMDIVLIVNLLLNGQVRSDMPEVGSVAIDLRHSELTIEANSPLAGLQIVGSGIGNLRLQTDHPDFELAASDSVLLLYSLSGGSFSGRMNLEGDFTKLQVREIIAVSPRGTKLKVNLLINRFELAPAFPNPFNPRTQIRFYLGESSPVSADVFDLQGRLVTRLTAPTNRLSAGYHSIEWDATGKASGIYLLRMECAGRVLTSKLVLLK